MSVPSGASVRTKYFPSFFENVEVTPWYVNAVPSKFARTVFSFITCIASA